MVSNKQRFLRVSQLFLVATQGSGMKNPSAAQETFSPLTVMKRDVCKTDDRSPSFNFFLLCFLINGGFVFVQLSQSLEMLFYLFYLQDITAM